LQLRRFRRREITSCPRPSARLLPSLGEWVQLYWFRPIKSSAYPRILLVSRSKGGFDGEWSVLSKADLPTCQMWTPPPKDGNTPVAVRLFPNNTTPSMLPACSSLVPLKRPRGARTWALPRAGAGGRNRQGASIVPARRQQTPTSFLVAAGVGAWAEATPRLAGLSGSVAWGPRSAPGVWRGIFPAPGGPSLFTKSVQCSSAATERKPT